MTRIRIALCLLGLIALPAQAAEHTVIVDDNFFEEADLTIEAGDSVTWTNQGSLAHNVAADDGSFRCAQGCDSEGGNGSPSTGNWSFTLTFDEPGEIAYHCELHGQAGGVGMAGTITVEQAGDDGMPINLGHTGSWYNADQDGQGFSLEVVPVEQDSESDVMVAYWFTFAPDEPGGPGRQRWFVAVGPIEGSEATLDVERTTGGVFDDPEGVAREVIGTLTIEFTSCTEAAVTYSLDLDGDGIEESTGDIPITRLTPDAVCQEMVSEGN